MNTSSRRGFTSRNEAYAAVPGGSTRVPKKQNLKGFTLIELMVVAAIISLLSSLLLATFGEARAKSRDAARLRDLRQLQTALENYRSSHTGYPSTADEWWGTCATWGSHGVTGTDGWIPGLAPTYIGVLPRDPRPAEPNNCYVYRSNGTDYFVMAYGTVETRRSADTNNGSCSPTPNVNDTNPANRPSQPTEGDFGYFTQGACRW